MHHNEKCAQVALVNLLKCGLLAQAAFLKALQHEGSIRFAEQGPFDVHENYHTDAGKFIDVVLISNATRRAVSVELKIGHKENSFQHHGYRESLIRAGYEVLSVGIMPITMRHGRAALGSAINATAADVRITWRELVERLPDEGICFLKFRKAIGAVSGAIVSHSQPFASPCSDCRDIRLVDKDDATLIAFLNEIIHRLPADIFTKMDQPGNAPPLLRFGRLAWANRLGDHDKTRIFLMVDYPRRAHPIPETILHFGFTLWSRNDGGQRYPSNIVTIEKLAYRLKDNGFWFQRNIRGGYRPQVWNSPFCLEKAGFAWANAFDQNNFCLTISEAAEMGWDNVVDAVSRRATQLIDLIDRCDPET